MTHSRSFSRSYVLHHCFHCDNTLFHLSLTCSVLQMLFTELPLSCSALQNSQVSLEEKLTYLTMPTWKNLELHFCEAIE